ncbi:hypothetical protein HMPREF1575_01203 [Gardnerella vaginalis JCP7672]|nr:hypothetical protein HMPREF1575_01203 [Gardnerella vaginalis JCP7672]
MLCDWTLNWICDFICDLICELIFGFVSRCEYSRIRAIHSLEYANTRIQLKSQNQSQNNHKTK